MLYRYSQSASLFVCNQMFSQYLFCSRYQQKMAAMKQKLKEAEEVCMDKIGFLKGQDERSAKIAANRT